MPFFCRAKQPMAKLCTCDFRYILWSNQLRYRAIVAKSFELDHTYNIQTSDICSVRQKYMSLSEIFFREDCYLFEMLIFTYQSKNFHYRCR